MDLTKYCDGIEKTGFKLEFEISQVLSRNKWQVINNKYYVDDLQESVREIDLVAYRAANVNHFHVYTVLIVSCKKSEKDAWAFLSKKRNPSDPNAEWLPVHAWSNDKALNYCIKEKEWKQRYLQTNKEFGSDHLSKIYETHIFAFQEMNKTSGLPNNDKNIFNSITSLMKAQAYEMNALSARKKTPTVFQFNLISVVDSEMLEIGFKENGIKANEVIEAMYVADYIIDKRQTSSKIHFVQASEFEQILSVYNDLHKANAKSFDHEFRDFFTNIERNSGRRSVFIDEINNDLLWRMNHRLLSNGLNLSDKSYFELDWDEGDKVLEYWACGDQIAVETLNSDSILRKALKSSLKKHLKYKGDSRFAEIIPF